MTPARCGATRVLWMTPTVAGRGITGREAYSEGLIRAANQNSLLEVSVHCACADRGELISARVKARSAWSRLPAMCAASHLRRNRKAIRSALRQPHDVLVVEHLQLGWVVLEAARRGTPCVFVSQNYESTARLGDEPRGIIRRLVARIDQFKVERLEKRVLQCATLTTAITIDDAEAFRRCGARVVRVLPPVALRQLVREPRIAEARVVAHFGSFIWSAKRQNLTDFLRESLPILEAADVRVRVIGPGDFESVAESLGRPQGLEYAGAVDEEGLQQVLQECRVAVVAEPRGGGFKMKVLDLIAAGVPLYVLKGSVAGVSLIDGVNCRIATTMADLAEAIVSEIDREDVLLARSLAAHEALLPFTIERVARQLAAVVEAAHASTQNRGAR